MLESQLSAVNISKISQLSEKNIQHISRLSLNFANLDSQLKTHNSSLLTVNTWTSYATLFRPLQLRRG